MAMKALDRQLAQLEAWRYRFGQHESARVVKLLQHLDAAHFTDPASLIRFHETLLFLRAFPHGRFVVGITERLLNKFHNKVEALHKSGINLNAFEPIEVSGIAGTEMEDTLSLDVARWLIKRMPGKVEIAWENYEPGRELGTTGPRFIPLLEDDAYVEADTPWRRWLEAAGGKKHANPVWLVRRFEQLPLPAQQKAELYESLRVPLRWNLKNSAISRTRNWKPARKVYYHREPLISRSQVSLAAELARPPVQLTKLSQKQGGEIMDLIREVMLVRYRELYGTTLGDPASVVRADLGGHEAGRGVSIYLWNLPPDRRLPLRAYAAGLTLKNGVPINYIEAIGLCEWMEVGFNTFYTFRGGEAGWIYAQVLRCLCHLMGTTCISVYPYQLGHDNEEAIESGAFWFYRKLGFRPGRAELQELAEREEAKIAADPKYRTPARTLRRLASGHVFYELPGSERGAWDTFSARNIGLRVNRRMAQEFQGDSDRLRRESVRSVARILGMDTSRLTAPERASFENFAMLLALVPGLQSWKRDEKDALVRIIRSKSNADEMLYLHLTQRHDRFREALLKVGS
ncbi:MAG: hypothetical protein LAO23_00070 [Acidobacteriia bacterium]|nr:hypothetical protein [Terriglobia bacterium]